MMWKRSTDDIIIKSAVQDKVLDRITQVAYEIYVVLSTDGRTSRRTVVSAKDEYGNSAQ
jgi:hypothetical protein